MKRRSSGCVLTLAALFAVVVTGCSDGVREKPAARARVTGLSVERVDLTGVPELFELTGTVKAKNSARLAARISATVTEVQVREGDQVRRGALLVTLAALESTAGASGAAHAVEEALARKRLADVTYERFAGLFQEQAVTRQELDIRRAERDMADRSLARAREAARAAAAVAGYTRITAPLSGVVTSRMIDPGSTVFPGMPLLTVEEGGEFRLELAVPESLQGKVALGTPLPVFLDGNGRTVTGMVAEIAPRVDPVSRTFTLKVDLPVKGLRSGQFGRARLRIGEKQGLLVPQRAVLERGQLTFVWVVDKGNIARMRLVKPGTVVAGRVEILAGLSAGERVVVAGMEKVTDGARVE